MTWVHYFLMGGTLTLPRDRTPGLDVWTFLNDLVAVPGVIEIFEKHDAKWTENS